MSSFAKQYAESLAQVSGKVALIADRDQFIATAGGGKAFSGKGLSRHLEDALERRETILAGKGEKQFLEIIFFLYGFCLNHFITKPLIIIMVS